MRPVGWDRSVGAGQLGASQRVLLRGAGQQGAGRRQQVSSVGQMGLDRGAGQ